MPSSGSQELEDRFWAKVVSTVDGCWAWQGALTNGYGVLTVDGKSRRVHRVAYEMFVGPIPEGLVIDHLCRNRACVNPAHMEPVTSEENCLRGVGDNPFKNAIKTHCKNGHEFTPENTMVRKERPGRTCRKCKNEWWRRQHAKKPKSQLKLRELQKAALDLLQRAPGVVTDGTTSLRDGRAWINHLTAQALERRGYVRIAGADIYLAPPPNPAQEERP